MYIDIVYTHICSDLSYINEEPFFFFFFRQRFDKIQVIYNPLDLTDFLRDAVFCPDETATAFSMDF